MASCTPTSWYSPEMPRPCTRASAPGHGGLRSTSWARLLSLVSGQTHVVRWSVQLLGQAPEGHHRESSPEDDQGFPAALRRAHRLRMGRLYRHYDQAHPAAGSHPGQYLLRFRLFGSRACTDAYRRPDSRRRDLRRYGALRCIRTHKTLETAGRQVVCEPRAGAGNALLPVKRDTWNEFGESSWLKAQQDS